VVGPATPVTIAAAALDEALRSLDVGAVEQGTDEQGAVGGSAVEQLRRARDLLAGLDPYVAAMTTPESAQLAALSRATAEQRWRDRPDAVAALEPEMLSGHVEAAFLQLLVRLGGARRVLEIGTFTGYATLAIAEALPADGVVVTCEADPRAAAVAREALGASPDGAKVELVEGPALATLARLDRPFDLVFVDADKEGYSAYLDLLLDRRLVAPGGLVVVDNTLMQGVAYGVAPRSEREAAQGRAIAAFNERVARDRRLLQVVLPVRDGVTLVQLRSDA
jgi:caffeoyl-CoA O-methyltransferase